MPISDFARASGVRIRRGQRGRLYSNVGVIYCVRPAKVGIDSNLWACLKIWVDECRIVIEINSIDTGKHAEDSRHYAGCAVDVWKVSPVAGVGEELRLASLTNSAAVKAVRWLRSFGFKNREQGSWPAALLGGPRTPENMTASPHRLHIHFSIPRR